MSSIWPIPLINIAPALTIALISIAYLQQDGLLLGIAFAIAVVSLLVFALVLWASADALGHIRMPWGNR
jgi:hypothetical protein